MANLVITGFGGERERSPGPPEPNQSLTLLRQLFIDKGLLYYWATDPLYWNSQGPITNAVLDRRLSIVSPIIKDLDLEGVDGRTVKQFWSSYDQIIESRVHTLEAGKTHWRIFKGAARMNITRTDPFFTEKVGFSLGRLVNRENLPAFELTLKDSNPQLLQIEKNEGFPNTSAKVFSKFINEYLLVRQLVQKTF